MSCWDCVLLCLSETKSCWDSVSLRLDLAGTVSCWDYASLRLCLGGTMSCWDYALLGLCLVGAVSCWDYILLGLCLAETYLVQCSLLFAQNRFRYLNSFVRYLDQTFCLVLAPSRDHNRPHLNSPLWRHHRHGNHWKSMSNQNAACYVAGSNVRRSRFATSRQTRSPHFFSFHYLGGYPKCQ